MATVVNNFPDPACGYVIVNGIQYPLCGSGGQVQIPLSAPSNLMVWNCVWNGSSYDCAWFPTPICPGGSYEIIQSGPWANQVVLTHVAGFCGPAQFNASVTPGSPTVSFQDQSPGSTAWTWDFGDGTTSTQASPSHTYAAPACYVTRYTVRHRAGVGAVCLPAVTQTISIQNTPPAGSAGVAYVIVGDVSTGNPILDAANLVREEQLAARAASRLAAQGYTVERRGYPLLSDFARVVDVQQAASDPNVRAIWISAHGNSNDEVRDNRATPQYRSFKMRDDNAFFGDIAGWRQSSGSTLDELTLFSCNAGSGVGLGFWGIDGHTRVSAAVGLTTVEDGIENEWYWRCAGGYPGMPHAADTRSVRDQAAVEAAYVPMHMITQEGVHGDELYGTVAGASHPMIANGSGYAEFFDAAAGISGALTGHAPFDTVSLWVNRYTASPVDTLPPDRSLLAAYVVQSRSRAAGTHLRFVSPIPLTVENTEMWRFDDSTRAFVQLPVTVDLVNNAVDVTTSRWGTFLLVVPTALLGAAEHGPVEGLRLAIHGNPVRRGESMRAVFTSPRSGRARVSIVDVAGAKVVSLMDADVHAGPHELTWSGRTFSGQKARAGVYFLVVDAGGARRTAPLILLE